MTKLFTSKRIISFILSRVTVGTILSRVTIDHVQSYQDFITKLFTSNKIISFICSINLVKPSLLLKFNLFIHNLTTFYFHLFHPTPMHLSMVCLALRFVVVLF